MSDNKGWKTIEQDSYSISLPQDWFWNQTSDTILFSRPEDRGSYCRGGYDYVTIPHAVVEVLAGDYTGLSLSGDPGERYNELFRKVTGLPNFEEISRSEVTIEDGRTAYCLEFKSTDAGTALQTLYAVNFQNGFLFVIECVGAQGASTDRWAFARHQETFLKIVQSLTVKVKTPQSKCGYRPCTCVPNKGTTYCSAHCKDAAASVSSRDALGNVHTRSATTPLCFCLHASCEGYALVQRNRQSS